MAYTKADQIFNDAVSELNTIMQESLEIDKKVKAAELVVENIKAKRMEMHLAIDAAKFDAIRAMRREFQRTLSRRLSCSKIDEFECTILSDGGFYDYGSSPVWRMYINVSVSVPGASLSFSASIMRSDQVKELAKKTAAAFKAFGQY